MGLTSNQYASLPGDDLERGQDTQYQAQPSAPPAPTVVPWAYVPPTPQGGVPQTSQYPQPAMQYAHYTPAPYPAAACVPTQPSYIAPYPNAPPVIYPQFPTDSAASFAERHVRQGFIRKVMGIVSLQLLATAAIAAYVLSSRHLREALTSTPAFYIVCFAPIAILIPLLCSRTAQHTYPLNMLLLSAFTIAEALLVGLVTSQYDTMLVLFAFGITACVTACLTLYAFQTKSDLTMSGSTLFTLLVVLTLCSYGNLFLHLTILETVISGCGALLFSVYIVYDVQLVVGGEHRVQLSPDDYIPAAINIYVDIVQLFLYILQILDESSR